MATLRDVIGSTVPRQLAATHASPTAHVDVPQAPRARSAREPEQCLDCMRPLTTDGVTWSCAPCGRGGCYSTGPRVIVVRLVTRWRAADGTVRHG